MMVICRMGMDYLITEMHADTKKTNLHRLGVQGKTIQAILASLECGRHASLLH